MLKAKERARDEYEDTRAHTHKHIHKNIHKKIDIPSQEPMIPFAPDGAGLVCSFGK